MPHLTPLHWIILPLLLFTAVTLISSLSWWSLPPSWPPSTVSPSQHAFSNWSWQN